ncbi:heat shock protein transcriptional repressor HspR, fused homodimer type [Oceanithermus desulfurans]|uniref:MerR family transcriptional regulator n=4 Tax=Oceanithermus TaxID=208447 RepID=A0A511RHZ1_9DEIN|nr:helix-turn-helix transcriptional regulator [Oceanithermus desulfurans]MBB6030428.1 MerR family transcriptional regulator/heat shock protein HspR [Oceanithermus desulfurans]GEM89271.1 MerR family transcriptional regulator [Oceanithermus desulfurans NBRC 100063]
MSKDRPVYIISVAAELVDMHPQTLRLYERKGLIRPKRSSGKTRLYSERDIEHLREIRRLTQELGVNLAGVEEIMRLRQELEALQKRFEAEAERLKQALQDEAAKIETPPALPGEVEEASKAAPSDRPVYVISVAAELVDMHPQTLRLYERKGLIRPKRSSGKTRLYSERDIEHLREIRRLTQELGVNLAGVEEIMRLRQELEALQERFEAEVGRLRLELLSKVGEAQGPEGKTAAEAEGEGA